MYLLTKIKNQNFLLLFVKSYPKFLFSKLNLLTSATICGLLFALFTSLRNRDYEKTSKLILKSKCSEKTRKIPKKTRSSHRRCSSKRDAFKNFAKFTGKHLCRSLFLNKFASYTLWKQQKTREYDQRAWSATLLKKRLQQWCVPVN